MFEWDIKLIVNTCETKLHLLVENEFLVYQVNQLTGQMVPGFAPDLSSAAFL